MLVKAYGQYWNPDVVDWGKKGAGNAGHLHGTVKIDNKNVTIDFWDARGIYILHDNFKTVYVGKAQYDSMGNRLRNHLTDRFAGRWDMFSWFSVSKPNKTKKNVAKPGKRSAMPGTVISTLESVGILITDAPLNRKRESVPDALEAKQTKSKCPHTIRHYLETILTRLSEKAK